MGCRILLPPRVRHRAVAWPWRLSPTFRVFLMPTTQSAVSNATAPEFLDHRELIAAFRQLRRGDFHVRLPDDLAGPDAELARLFNEVVGINEQMAREFQRLSRVVGKEGKINQRGHVNNATGGWESAIHAVNELIDDMVQPTSEVARVIGAVAKGDL